MKTVASINGKPVSTVAGEPGSGSSQREDIDDLGPPPAAGSRISGRVFDQDGRAVPNARVRLGVGATAGGRVNFATTDRSGAFTLHGLRPGRDYTVIAEYQAADGMMSGRVQAHAPDTGVRIALGARDPEPEPEPARGSKILPARVRSSLFPENETDGFPAAAARPRVQDAEEPADRDAEPPADEATSYAPRTKRTSAAKLASASAPSSATVRAGWTVRQQPTEARARRPRTDADTDDPRDGPPSPADRGAGDDEGENPLPPALEPDGSGASRPSGRTGSGSTATGRVSSNQRKPRPRRPDPASEESLAVDDREPGSLAAAPRPIPDDAFPASAEIARASYSQGGGRSTDDDAAPMPRKPANVRRSPRAATSTANRPRDAVRPSRPDPAAESDESPDDGTSRTRSNRRPTWRELSISPDDVPVDESLRRSSVDDETDERDAVKRAGGPDIADADQLGDTAMADEAPAPRISQSEPRPIATADEVRPRRIRPASVAPIAARRPALASAPATGSKAAESVCRLDAAHRRIVELRLMGLDGKPVSLADIDADFILLDFWGSWCRQCDKSIEHHREIQEQIGGKRLQVIGVACEKGATFEARRDTAAAIARKLGINYPVLVTSMDGSCPVQKALQVQFYPSMVLIDREGNILQFEQGATDTTLSRIDRAIAKAVRDGDRRDGE
jgi:peroxiredoxin